MPTMTNYSGPYTVAHVPTFDRETGAERAGKPNRHNDGAMIIMGKDADGDSVPVLNIPMRLQPKRGQGWDTTDPDQEAFAAFVVEVLNRVDVA